MNNSAVGHYDTVKYERDTITKLREKEKVCLKKQDFGMTQTTNERLLYFPYISIPNAAWLTQALLYWDGVATIVPCDYLKQPRRFTPFARALLQEGVIQAVPPEEYAYSFTDDYLRFLDWVQQHRDCFRLERTRQPQIRQYNLHIGKLGFMGDEFVRMGLAVRVDLRWYMVSKSLSMSFMTFLAMLIGRNENYIPTTDTYQGMSALINIEPQSSGRNAQAVRGRFRNSILESIFPVPCNVDLYDILRFKEKYHDELIRFRRKVETFISFLETLPSEEQQRQCQSFLLDIEDELEELKGQMRWFRAPRIDFGTLIAALPSAFSIANKDSLGAVANLSLLLCELIWNRTRTENLHKPLAYAALYQNRFYTKS